MPGVRDIKIRFSGDASGLTKAATEGEQSVGRFSDRTQKVAKVALVGVAAFGAGMVAALKGGVQGLQEGEEAEAKFADALSRSTSGMRGQAEALKANAEELQKNTRFTYEQGLAISSAIAQHASLSGVVSKGITDAVGLTNITADLATVMGTDGAAAAEALAKAMAKPESASRFLTKAGVDLSVAEEEQIKAWIKSGDTAKAQGFILDELKSKSEGAAKAAGETTAGQMERAKNAFGEVQEQLAVGLMPAITDLMAWLVKVTAWAQENPEKIKLVVIVLGSLAAIIGTVSLAITTWTAITRVATAVQAAWNVVMAANPIVLVTLAVVGLIAVIVLIATKTTWFQQIWKAAMGAIQGAISGAFNWIKSNWPTILAVLTGPVGLAVLAIARHKDRILDLIGAIPETARRLFSGLTSTLTAPFSAAVGAIRSAWNSTLGGKGWDGVNIPLGPDVPGFRIPMLARGGTARGGMAHIVGEEGPELFVPGVTGRVVPNGEFGAGDTTVEIYGNGDPSVLEALIDRVVVKRNRTTKLAVQAGSRRAFA